MGLRVPGVEKGYKSSLWPSTAVLGKLRLCVDWGGCPPEWKSPQLVSAVMGIAQNPL